MQRTKKRMERQNSRVAQTLFLPEFFRVLSARWENQSSLFFITRTRQVIRQQKNWEKMSFLCPLSASPWVQAVALIYLLFITFSIIFNTLAQIQLANPFFNFSQLLSGVHKDGKWMIYNWSGSKLSFWLQSEDVIGSCVFWQIGLPQRTWLTRGCVRVEHESSARVTTCECDHLTVFAVLMNNKPVKTIILYSL